MATWLRLAGVGAKRCSCAFGCPSPTFPPAHPWPPSFARCGSARSAAAAPSTARHRPSHPPTHDHLASPGPGRREALRMRLRLPVTDSPTLPPMTTWLRPVGVGAKRCGCAFSCPSPTLPPTHDHLASSGWGRRGALRMRLRVSATDPCYRSPVAPGRAQRGALRVRFRVPVTQAPNCPPATALLRRARVWRSVLRVGLEVSVTESPARLPVAARPCQGSGLVCDAAGVSSGVRRRAFYPPVGGRLAATGPGHRCGALRARPRRRGLCRSSVPSGSLGSRAALGAAGALSASRHRNLPPPRTPVTVRLDGFGLRGAAAEASSAVHPRPSPTVPAIWLGHGVRLDAFQGGGGWVGPPGLGACGRATGRARPGRRRTRARGGGGCVGPPRQGGVWPGRGPGSTGPPPGSAPGQGAGGWDRPERGGAALWRAVARAGAPPAGSPGRAFGHATGAEPGERCLMPHAPRHGQGGAGPSRGPEGPVRPGGLCGGPACRSAPSRRGRSGR